MLMDNLLHYTELGLRHILDLKNYEHLLFFVLLALPYNTSKWKHLATLALAFIAMHSISVLLASQGVLNVNGLWMSSFIPYLIIIVSIVYIFSAQKTDKESNRFFILLCSILYGLIHGLSFVATFHAIKRDVHALIPAAELALGMALGVFIVFFCTLFLGFLFKTIFRFSNRDWTMVLSSFIFGLALALVFKTTFSS